MIQQINTILEHHLKGQTFIYTSKYGGQTEGVIKSIKMSKQKVFDYTKGVEFLTTPSGKKIPDFSKLEQKGYNICIRVTSEYGNIYDIQEITIKT